MRDLSCVAARSACIPDISKETPHASPACHGRVHLRHLSEDCRRLLDRAGDLVEVNISEDPHYHVATDRAKWVHE